MLIVSTIIILLAIYWSYRAIRKAQLADVVQAQSLAIDRNRALSNRLTKLSVDIRDRTETVQVGVQLIGVDNYSRITFPLWETVNSKRGYFTSFTLTSPIELAAGAVLMPIGPCRITCAQSGRYMCGTGLGGTTFAVVQGILLPGAQVSVIVKADD